MVGCTFLPLISCMLYLTHQCTHCVEIIDGKVVPPHSMPYMVLLQNHKSAPVCGGVLIGPEWVLTAAHCGSIKKVLLGVRFYKKDEPSRQVREVSTSIPHEYFDEHKFINDLMLLKLDKPAKQSEDVKPRPLNSVEKDPKAGSVCLVAGWGSTTKAAGRMSNVLRSVNVTVMDRAKCKQSYKRSHDITTSMICAGSDGTNRADTCTGDSGGPLLCKGKLIGVTSFGDECGQKDKPGVYTFLTKKHLTWIKKKIKKHAFSE